MIRPVICIDGTRVRLRDADLDGDGVTGGIESIDTGQKRRDLPMLQQKSELGEVVDVINKDEIEQDIGMSSFDKLSRLHTVQIPAIAVWDYLCKDSFLTEEEMHLTRQIKRLMVSLEGKGRGEIVDMTGRSQERKSGSSFADKIKGMFGGGGGQP